MLVDFEFAADYLLKHQLFINEYNALSVIHNFTESILESEDILFLSNHNFINSLY